MDRQKPTIYALYKKWVLLGTFIHTLNCALIKCKTKIQTILLIVLLLLLVKMSKIKICLNVPIRISVATINVLQKMSLIWSLVYRMH